MEEEIEFKDGIERLEYLIGTNIERIRDLLNIIPLPYSKEIIELRFGIRDGREYTLFEVADIIKEKENNKSVIDRYLSNIKGVEIKPIFGEWNAEAVRKTEATTIRIIKKIIENNIEIIKD